MVSLGAACSALALLAAGCGENRFDRTVTGTGVGAATGAAAGALLGPIGVVTGALIGAGAGGGIGLTTDEDQINLGRPIYR
jgi:hypothetical protein